MCAVYLDGPWQVVFTSTLPVDGQLHDLVAELRQGMMSVEDTNKYRRFFSYAIHQNPDNFRRFFRVIREEKVMPLYLWGQKFVDFFNLLLRRNYTEDDFIKFTDDEVFILLSFEFPTSSPSSKLAEFKTLLAQSFLSRLCTRAEGEGEPISDVLVEMTITYSHLPITLENLEKILLQTNPVPMLFVAGDLERNGQPPYLSQWIGKTFSGLAAPFTHEDYFSLVRSVISKLSTPSLTDLLNQGCIDYILGRWGIHDVSEEFLFRLSLVVYDDAELVAKITSILKMQSSEREQLFTDYCAGFIKKKLVVGPFARSPYFGPTRYDKKDAMHFEESKEDFTPNEVNCNVM